MTARVSLFAVALALGALAPGVVAQPGPPGPAAVAWERLPLVPLRPQTQAHDVLFLDGGADGDRSVVWVSGYGPLRYDPGGDGNWEGSDWARLCERACRSDDGLLTSEGSVLIGVPHKFYRRSPAGAWEYEVLDGQGTFDLHQTALPALRNDRGHGAVFAGVRYAHRSDDDGRTGTWDRLGATGGELVTFGEVPPSSALPDGRLLAGVYNGVTYSDDGGRTWAPGAGAYGFSRYIADSFTFVPDPAHPYGGAVLAGVDDLAFDRDSSATVYRSDDGGATWARAHRFSPSALGLANANEVQVLAAPDGVVWAAVTYTKGGLSRNRTGAIARSVDGGRTWAPAQDGYGGHGLLALVAGPDGRVYAGSEVGVWRTTVPVFAVAGEGGPEPPGGLGLTVHPNPAGGRAAVTLALAAPAAVRVAVLDARGREVAVAWDGPARDGQRVEVATGGLAPGVYVVRAVAAGGARATARLTVVR